MAQLFETAMLLCFGASWPFNIARSLRSRTAKGKSLLFEVCVIVGYLCGVAGKIAGDNVTYVLWVYLLDICMVSTDLCLTLRKRRLDRLAERQAAG